MSGIVCWIWLTSAGMTAAPPASGTATITSEVAQVADQDVTAALTTMNGSLSFLTQFRQRTGGCPLPLAWVSVARVPGQPSGTVRFRSGTYFPPVFDLSDIPQRVALPYPGPYETGHGALTVMNAGGGAIVALTPALQVSTQSSNATRAVTWPVNNRCRSPGG
jgi:hypothetical protein